VGARCSLLFVDRTIVPERLGLVEVLLPFNFFLTDAMCFIPVQLCLTNLPAPQANPRYFL
jgi:hypothetical protein